MNRKHLSSGKVYSFFAVFLTFVMIIGSTVPVSAKSQKPAKPNISVSALVPGDSAKITISETSGADGYKIVMKAPGEKKYKKVKTIKKDGTSVRTYTIEGLSDGKYYFKVRAYSKSGKKTVWGSYSKAKSITIKNISKSEPRVVTNFANAESGDFVTFGHYEQDNDASNGAEPIEWLVLSNNGSELFLLSKYALDSKEFHDDLVASWETCSLRSWLNEDFYNVAFSDEEKNMVKTTSLKNEDNTQYGTNGGKDTKDKVFLVSASDINNASYGLKGPQDENSKCIATAYAAVQAEGDNYYGTSVANGPCVWWLRTIGCAEECSAVVASNGILVLEGDVHIFRNGVRPALTIEITDTKNEETVKDNNSTTDNSKNVVAEQGEIITFGSYEQDGNIANGKEPIEWIVLSKDENHMLVLSKDVIERRYFDHNNDATWENSYIREWLNTEFYDTAFDDDEKPLIEEVNVDNSSSHETGIICGNDTKDKVFLLSLQEVTDKKYGFESEYMKADSKRSCSITNYAKTYLLGAYYGDEKDPCMFWMLRTLTDNAGEKRVCVVALSGAVLIGAGAMTSPGSGIRPALYIQIR